MNTRHVLPRFAVFFFLSTSLVAAGLAGCGGDDGQEAADTSVAISYPTAGAFINKSRFLVRGTAEGTSTVRVNGKQTEVSSGKWEVLVDFEEGPATATVEANSVESAVDFVVDTIAPKIVLESPERGLILEEDGTGEVTFFGRVTEESSGLKVLGLDGAGVTYDEDGNFSHTARLKPGYNEFELKAIDHAGNLATTRRAALYGPVADPESEIDSAAEILVAPQVFDTASAVIISLLTPERVTEFVHSAMQDNENIAVDSVQFDNAQVAMVPHSADQLHANGYLTLELSVENATIVGTASFGGDDYPATITIDQLKVSTEVLLDASPTGGLDISFNESVLEVEDEHLHFDVAGATEQDLNDGLRDFLRGAATNVAKIAFSELLSDELFAALYDPGMLRRKVELLGRTLEFQLYIRQVRITQTDGIFLRAALAVVSPKFDAVPDVPGALNLAQGARSASTLDEDMLFTTGRTAVNRLLHGAWRSGLFNQRLVGADFAGFELPVELNASALSLLLDSRISQLADGSPPAGLQLRPLLPPVVSLSSQPSADGASDGASEDAQGNDIRLHVGGLMADMELLPEGAAPIKIVSVALFLDVTARFEARDGRLALSLTAQARADVDEEPTLDLDDNTVEDLLENLVTLATQMIGNELVLGAQTELGWLKIESPKAEIHGAEGDQLSVGAGISTTLP